jgi:amidohydrolase
MQQKLNSTHLKSLCDFRHQLHSLPELSGNEKQTAVLITERLSKLRNINRITNVGGYGILAIADSGKKGKTVVFRADMDALPIKEINGFEYKSQHEYISHTCGHDGHLTVLCGLAELLNKELPKSGKVILLFQPSEEDGKGASNVLNDAEFKNIEPDYVFAFHNLPGFPIKQVVIRDNVFSASVLSMIFKLQGKTSHAAEPENGINPAFAIAEIIFTIKELTNNDTDSEALFMATPVYSRIGEIAYGTSAAYGEIHYTFRAWENKLLEYHISNIKNEIATIAQKHQLILSTEVVDQFHSTSNHPSANQVLKQSCISNNIEYTEIEKPFRWGEDFGLFTQKFKGALFGIGAGENCPALHNADYDFPDEIIACGITIFQSISQLINK